MRHYVTALAIPSVILPKLSSVLSEMLPKAPMFLSHAATTAYEVVAGFAAVALVGATLGTVIASSELVGSAVYPVLIATQVMPKVAITPIFII